MQEITKTYKFHFYNIIALSVVMIVILLNTSLTAYANSRHPMSRFRDYNYYKGYNLKSWDDANKLIKEDKLILINTEEYEHWEELHECMTEEGDDYYDFVLWDFYNEGQRLYIYASEEMVETFLKTNNDTDRTNGNYYMAKIDFIHDIMIVYEYSLPTSDTGESNQNLNKKVDLSGDWGTLVVQGYIDGQIIENINPDINASLTVQNIDTGDIYNIELSPINDFANTANITCGWYKVTSAFYSAQYSPVVYLGNNEEKILYKNTESADTFYMGKFESHRINITFGKPMTKEEYIEKHTEEIIDEVETLPADEEPILPPEEKKNRLPLIIFVSILTIVIGGLAFCTIYLYKKNKNENRPH